MMDQTPNESEKTIKTRRLEDVLKQAADDLTSFLKRYTTQLEEISSDSP